MLPKEINREDLKISKEANEKLASANGVVPAQIIFNDEEINGYYKPISDNYPIVLAINELLMLQEYALVLPPDKVAIKIPVYDQSQNILGVFCKALINFEDMTESTLTTDDLIARGFIELLWQSYFYMENDLHPQNLDQQARLFDADKSNYPYIAKIIGHRYIEKADALSHFHLTADCDFVINEHLLTNFPEPEKGPYFWPTHARALSCVKIRFPNYQAFIDLKDHPKKMKRLYLAITKTLMVTKEIREATYHSITKDETIIQNYLDIFEHRKQIVRQLLIRNFPSYADYLMQNKETILKKLLAHFHAHDNDMIKIQFQKILFDTNTNELADLLKKIIAIANKLPELKLKEKIFQLYIILIKMSTKIYTELTINSLQDFIQKYATSLSSLKKLYEKEHSTVFKQLNHLYQSTALLINNLTLEKPLITETEEEHHFILIDPSHSIDLPEKQTIDVAIAQAILFFLERTNLAEILPIIETGYDNYINRPAEWTSSFFLGVPKILGAVASKTNIYHEAITKKGAKVLFITILDVAKKNNTWTSSSLNTYTFNAIFAAIKLELNAMNMIEICKKYPSLSMHTKEEIEAFNFTAQAEHVFQLLESINNDIAPNVKLTKDVSKDISSGDLTINPYPYKKIMG